MSRVGFLLDAGDVLIRPVNGSRWFPPPGFDDLLLEQSNSVDTALLDQALGVGGAFLDEVHAIPLSDERAERSVWVRYYEIVVETLGLTTGKHEVVTAATSAWENARHIEPYPWTVPVLSELQRQGIPVVVLSDAWPSLRRWFRELELDGYVRAMVISGEEGITKPDRRVFDKALGLLGLPPHDVTFVDDYAVNVRAAAGIGVNAFRLRHPGQPSIPDVPEIADLLEILGSSMLGPISR